MGMHSLIINGNRGIELTILLLFHQFYHIKRKLYNRMCNYNFISNKRLQGRNGGISHIRRH